MAVSDGGNGIGEGQFTQSVISATPGTAQFDGVWLIGEAWGQQAASPNVGLTLESRGMTVTGPGQDQSSTLPWTWVQHFKAGAPRTFPDGRAATVVEVSLVERNITLLVPTDQLSTDEIDELNRYLPVPVAVPEPSPPFEGLNTDEAIHFTDVPENTEIAGKTDSDTASTTASQPVADRKPGRDSKFRRGSAKRHSKEFVARSSRLAVLLACLLTIAIAGTVVVALRIKDDNTASGGIVIPQAPPTTTPPVRSTLTGPPASAKSLTVAEQVNLSLADLPAGWSKVVFVGKAPVPSAFADVHSSLDQNLASCLRLPLTHVGIITGSGEPGGPRVWPSDIYDSNSTLHPSAISVASLVSSATVEQSDLAILLQPGTSYCLDRYYASSFASEHVTSAPLVNRFNVVQHAGEEVIGLYVHIGITQNGRPSVYDYDVVVIGAGRLEIALGAQQSGEPFPSSTLDRAVQAIEARAAVAAGPH
jgi:hypothetical protein